MSGFQAAQAASLDPLETILPGGARENSPRPAGADGEWTSGWSSTRADLPRLWTPGWDRGERCPAASRTAAPRGGWRELGAVGGERWHEMHEARRRVQNTLRRAGYVARHRWAREDTAPAGSDKARWVYTSGPAAGRRAVDPWAMAAELSTCGAEWFAQARVTDGGELRAVALPRTCGRAHLCPVCAARESSTMAAALRSLTVGGRGALVTLTHRDRAGRSLAQELDRLRSGMARLWSGRARAEWAARISGWWYGVETTYNEKGGWWHVHAHIILKVADGIDDEAAARWVGERWAAASAAAAVEAGLPEWCGWDPSAGGVTWASCSKRPVWTTVDPSKARPGRRWRTGGLVLSHEVHETAERWVTSDGGWWAPVDLSEPRSVYQACKYPTPCVELGPVQLAEFCAAAHGRRWHDGGGEWRGVRARAAELAAGLVVDDEAPGYDIGRNVSLCGPGEAPALDTVAPGLGTAHEVTAPELVPGVVGFLLTGGAPVELVAAAAEPVGGRVYLVTHRGRERWRLVLPAFYVGALVHEWHEAIRAAREAQADAV